MSCKIYNKTNSDFGELDDHIKDMYGFFAKKYSFDKPTSIHLKSDEQNKAEILGKTAYYDPQSFEVHIYTDGRHPKDILRSIAHELIHHKQNLEQRLEVGGYNGPGYYLENDDLKEVEHEAMLEGNACMREWEDTKKYKENKDMSLKEWKNNELNKLLLERWAILSESKKKPDADGDGVPDWADKKDGKGEKALKGKKIKNPMPKKGKNKNDNDPEAPKGAPPAAASEEDKKQATNEAKDCLDESCGDYKKMEEDRVSESKSKSLQESIKRLSRAKNIFFKGRRVK